jgi:hypothetical protein
MITKKISLLLFFLIISCLSVQTQEHPKGIISADELSVLRQRIEISPYKEMYEEILSEELAFRQKTERSVYEHAILMRLQAFSFALNNEPGFAQRCFKAFELLENDTVFVRNPYSFGLTRGAVLRDMAFAYDFCYPAWTNQQRIRVANILFELMQGVAANMGVMANYRLESNWMGVRYGSALMAAIVLNDSLNNSLGRSTQIEAHIWDTKERLRDHVRASHTPDGWFVETMGYHYYDGQFVWPAIIAFQNMHTPGMLTFEEYAPNLLNGFAQHITGTISIKAKRGLGIKPDLANDNPSTAFTQWPLWMRIVPEANLPWLNWMHDYLYDGENIKSSADLFYSILFFDAEHPQKNPAEEGFLTYHEANVGLFMFRNRFKDSNDIVAAFNTPSKRFGGHAGPDNLTFRIFGLGSLWAVGTGRTGNPAGQTALFPSEIPPKHPSPLPPGNVEDYQLNSLNGSGYAISSGSCMGVEDQTRLFLADYSDDTGAAAVFVVKDVSQNGRIWRLHTPGFNQVEITENAVVITSPAGSTMMIRVPEIAAPKFSVSPVRYGGETTRNNPGIGYNGEYYLDNHLIDVECDKDILVILTLQEAGKTHPSIQINKKGTRIKAGDKTIRLPKL